VDFTRPQAAMERAFGASWDLWRELSAIYPAAVPLADFLQRAETDPEAFPDDPYGDAMFAAYREQPLIKAYRDHPFSLRLGRLSFPNPSEHPVIEHQEDREAYVNALSPEDYYAWLQRDVLTLDGWWVEPDGLLAVHGACDPDRCVHTAPAVGPATELYLASLPSDTLLVRLHCHCWHLPATATATATDRNGTAGRGVRLGGDRGRGPSARHPSSHRMVGPRRVRASWGVRRSERPTTCANALRPHPHQPSP
jgi:hypothetical protein